MQNRTSSKFIISLLSVFSVLILSIGGYLIFDTYSTRGNTNSPISTTTEVDQDLITPPKPPTPESISVDMAFFGDVFWGRYFDEWSQNSPEKYNYPFRSLDTIGKKPREYWVANLECPITDSPLDAKTQENLLKFNCSPEYLPSAKVWFDAFGLANNHTDNMQEVDGFAQTRDYLKANDIPSFGKYDNSLDSICSVVAVTATASFGDSQSIKTDQSSTNTPTATQQTQDKGRIEKVEKIEQKTYRIPVALCGYHGIFRQLTDEEILKVAEFARFMPTFAMPHSGKEYVTTPDQIKTSAYQAMIDAGADAVLGGHPHSVQSSEIYKGKLIAYSLGNFIFDQQYNQMVTTSLGLRTKITVPYNTVSEQWQALPDSCFNVYYVCKEIKTLTSRPLVNISYVPIYISNSNKDPRAADDRDQAYIKKLSTIEKSLTELAN